MALVALLASLLVLLLSALQRWPGNFRRRRAARRRRHGEAALTSGIVALAAGDPAQAQLAARRAEALLSKGAPEGSPVALLLVADAAPRQGNRAEGLRGDTALLDRPGRGCLGLRGPIGR